MKKILFMLVAVLCMGLVSCNSCKSEKADNATKDSTEAVVNSDSALVLENIISMDRQDMYTNYKQDYRWYESCVVLKDFMDDENCDGTIAGVSNVFQYMDNVDEKSADVYVVLYTHTPDTTSVEVKHAFWVEDMPMNDDAIKVTFKEAFDKMMQANCPKPHSRNCVLRKEVGPNTINPQYIFGNSQAQIYVDAVTGAVTDKNPAFPTELKMPLGEWP